jgi:hypothetical protein
MDVCASRVSKPALSAHHLYHMPTLSFHQVYHMPPLGKLP